MKEMVMKFRRASVIITAILLSLTASDVGAKIQGITGTTFNLTARSGYISAGDGNSLFVWGFANGGGGLQYPGPTLIVNEGATVTVVLTNTLAVPVSLVFPGQANVTATGGIPGLLTREAEPNGGTVTYTFDAPEPGTYMYQSGTRPDLQVEMGLLGALIVRPAGFNELVEADRRAYNHPDSQYRYEYLVLHTEMDHRIHELVEAGRIDGVDNNTWFPYYWFFNGRGAPDTFANDNAAWLPTQPYGSMLRVHPGEKVLMRIIGGGRDPHPFHHHGNNGSIIARDGRLLSSLPGGTGGQGGAGADLAQSHFTETVIPGQTLDVIYDEWTGANLGWDVYGHEQDIDNDPTGNFPGSEDIDHNGNGVFDSVPMAPNEFAADHGKPFPVILPDQKDLFFGMFWSGSPFLGSMGALPPGEGGFNVNGGLAYMFHSHNEKEMTNNDIFPGGMMTFLIVEPHWAIIDQAIDDPNGDGDTGDRIP